MNAAANGFVLVLSVGGSLAPLEGMIRQHAGAGLDHVYFIASSDLPGRPGSARSLENETVLEARLCPKCRAVLQPERRLPSLVNATGLSVGQYTVEEVADPDTFEETWRAVAAVAADIAARAGTGAGGTPPRVLANIIGGTKVMAFALGLYAVYAGWEVWTNIGPRTDVGSIIGGDNPVAHQLAPFRADEALRLSRRLSQERLDYEGAVEMLRDALSLPGVTGAMRQRLFSEKGRLLVQMERDRFDYDAAARRLKEYVSATDPDRVAGVRQLESLAWVRARLGSDERWPDHDKRRGWELVEDLVANAERCSHRGRYDDAVARLYRATELLAQLRLRRVYDIRTGDVRLDRPPIAACPAALDLLEKARCQALQVSEGRLGSADAGDGQVKIGLWQAYSLLDALSDPLGAYFLADSRHLKGFMEMRHRSILAHGLDPVSREQWGDLGVRWIEWLRGARRPLLSRSR